MSNQAEDPKAGAVPQPNPPSQPRPRVYEKPMIRKYDQIDQVKPYGPSELEAG